jgi:small subunit ribosomal protein S6
MTQPYYETMYILRPDIPEEEVETHVAKYRDIVVEAGGEVLDCQMRGKRRLAYQIAKHREGIYLTVKQDGPMPAPRSIPGAPAEVAEPAGV